MTQFSKNIYFGMLCQVTDHTAFQATRDARNKIFLLLIKHQHFVLYFLRLLNRPTVGVLKAGKTASLLRSPQ